MSSTRRQDYFAELTGVRAISAYAVFNYHFNLFSREWFGETLFRLSHEMYLGVNVFYVLSGFLIFYRYGQKLTAPSGAFLAEYARNRFARIYPVYFLVLTLGYLWSGWPDLRTGLATYTLTQAYFPDLVKAGIPQAWTLTIEETFYFAAPLIFLLVRRATVLAPCLLFAGLALFLATVNFPGNPYYGNLTHMLGRTLLGVMPCFACGIFLAQVVLRHPERLEGGRRPIITYLALLASLGFVVWLSRLGQAAESALAAGEVGRGRDSQHAWWLLFVLFPILVSFFFYGLLTERSVVRQLLGSRLLVLLGGSSYAFYLIHIGVFQQLIFDYVSENYLVLFLLLNLLAIVLFKFYEKPLGRWIKSSGKRSVEPVQISAEISSWSRQAMYWILVAAVAAVFVWPIALRGQQKAAAEEALLAEDGIYESLQAVLCLGTAALLLFAAMGQQAKQTLRRSERIWRLLLAMMLLFMVGEELSWGQRLFHLQTPDWWARRNHQAEISFHNDSIFQPSDTGNRLQEVWLAGMLIFLTLVPLGSLAAPAIKKRLEALGLPIASLPIALLFGASLAFHSLCREHSEVLELAIDILIFALAIEIAAQLTKNAAQSRRQAFVLATVPASILAVALVVQAGSMELPTAASLRLTDRAKQELSRQDRTAAIATLREAIALWPRNVQARFDLATALIEQQENVEAYDELEEARRLAPDRFDIHVQLGRLLVERGDFEQAVDELDEALRLKPDSGEIANNLAVLLAACSDDRVRDGRRAVILAEQACDAFKYQQPMVMSTLAAAYAEAGRYDDAVKMSDRAYDLAVAQHNSALADRIHQRQQLYLARKPYRIGK